MTKQLTVLEALKKKLWKKRLPFVERTLEDGSILLISGTVKILFNADGSLHD